MGYKLVCLDCQKAFNLESDFVERAKQSEKCPECGQVAIRYLHRFRPPKKSDDKAWEVVRFLYENGFAYHRHITNADRSGYEKYPETMREAREFVERMKFQNPL
ncbi:hypothetical protein GCM10023091_16340 [Ravibacter arvi]|uniref:Zinc ribbon domain-containing protein n=1 Tax=Ravibacter arvi TaxID=2051041 RepID=A0ABP8LWI0_9BACT